MECFRKEFSSNSACKVPEFKGLHTEGLHDLLMEPSSVNTMEYEEEEDNNEGIVNIAAAEYQHEGNERWRTSYDLWLDFDRRR